MSLTAFRMIVSEAEVARRVDKILVELLDESQGSTEANVLPLVLSRARVQQLIKEGHVYLDGQACKPSTRARLGQRLEMTIPKVKPMCLVPEAMELDILMEDSDLLVINKARGLVVHPGAGHDTGTLVHGLLDHCDDLSGIGGVERPGIVHRLDRGTTGAIVVAKTDHSHEFLCRAFQEREIQKKYLALVHGMPPRTEMIADTFYGRHPTNRMKFTGKLSSGKRAVTKYRTISVGPGLSLVEVILETGRTHQIRVHLSEAGYPLLGDALYGGATARGLKGQELMRLAKRQGFQMLHAYRLEFSHPRTGARKPIIAAIPSDFGEFCCYLETGWEIEVAQAGQGPTS